MKNLNMKCTNAVLVSLLFLLAGCEENKQSTDDFITVDVTASYPQKELILQDFMDVEYIPLETNDEFVCGNYVRAVGRNHVIMTNRDNDGDIFVFDRSGKAVRKINRQGQGGEEYTISAKIVLDEENNEMLVNDIYAKKILVYDLEGNFKRKLKTSDDFLFFDMYDFDKEHLICHDCFNDNNSLAFHTGQSFMLLSKQDGSITKEIQIPYEEKKSIVIRTPKDEKTGMYSVFKPSSFYPIVPYFDDYVLDEISSDTIYSYSSDQTMKPLIVRTPPVCSMAPERFLLLSLLTHRYYFMEIIEKKRLFPFSDIVYDKQEKAIFSYKVYNSDYTNDEEAFLKSIPLNGEIPSCQYLEAHKLVEDYEAGRLKGRLKEIASKLDPEDNPVIMLIKHKK